MCATMSVVFATESPLLLLLLLVLVTPLFTVPPLASLIAVCHYRRLGNEGLSGSIPVFLCRATGLTLM
jgi:hypothetical protein